MTYGLGRFYRFARRRVGRLIAVDIARYDWEVKPHVFYQMDATVFVSKVISGEIDVDKPDIVVVDPPWSSEKRGRAPRETGISHMPYHMSVKSTLLISAAEKLASFYRTHLFYRYKQQLNCSHIVRANAEVKMMRKRGIIYYGICNTF